MVKNELDGWSCLEEKEREVEGEGEGEGKGFQPEVIRYRLEIQSVNCE